MANKNAMSARTTPSARMTIMRNVKAASDGIWEGGEIRDQNNGKVRRVRLKPLDAGQVLEMRGYLGLVLPQSALAAGRMRHDEYIVLANVRPPRQAHIEKTGATPW